MGRDWRDRVRLWVIVGVIVAIPLSICVYFWFVVRGSPIGSRSGVFGGRGLDPAEGLVAFTATGEGSRSLQVIDVDGDDPVVIDEGLSHQSSPSWSPDGSQVVYAVDSGTDQMLWVAPAGGGGAPVQLTSREGEGFSQDQRPVWSPDRGRVAFISNRGSEIGSIVSIYVMAAAGGTPERIGPDPIDSQVCAELGGEMRCDVRPTGDARRVTWLPGSGDLVYLAEVMGITHYGDVDGAPEPTPNMSRVHRIRADGTGPELVAEVEGPLDQLAVSPDGRFVLYGLSAGDAHVLDLASGDTNRIGDGVETPSWSVDGERLIFVDDGQVRAADAEGRDVESLTRIVHGESIDSTIPVAAVWSPDRRHVAFVDNRSEDDVLYVMNADGTGQTDIVDNVGDIEDLHWLSPPG